MPYRLYAPARSFCERITKTKSVGPSRTLSYSVAKSVIQCNFEVFREYVQ